MIEISYLQMVVVISLVWLVIRTACWIKTKRISLFRELQLLLQELKFQLFHQH